MEKIYDYDIKEVDGRIQEIASNCESELKKVFAKAENIERINTTKVMRAFNNNRLSETHFIKTTGYGYDDAGRSIIEKIYAEIFHTEDALVRIQFVNGTHALSTALMGNLKAGDVLLSITGMPYDTLSQTIGISENGQSLIANGVKYEQIELLNDEFDFEKIHQRLQNTDKEKVTMVFITRSRGYSTRKALLVEQIGEVIEFIKKIDSNILVMVDNSYGEFVEKKEPTDFGADIMAGSLIKNIGGGICEMGAYIVGKSKLVTKASERLTAPGIGKECGATLGKNKEILQGLFLAPQVVKNAIKSACFTSMLMEKLGYQVSPKFDDIRSDIVQMIYFKNKEKLISFIQGIQQASPIDSFVTPMPWDMPGYTEQVIMAAGTFVSGSSIELSADAPIKPPYVAYIQGGLTYESARYTILKAINNSESENKYE